MAGLGGVIGTIIGWTGYQLGQRTDGADAAGSLHSKVKYLNDNKIPTTETNINNNVNTRQKPRGAIKGLATTSSTSYATALDISGKGCLKWMKVKTNSGINCYFKVTVDGNVTTELSTLSTSYIYPIAFSDLSNIEFSATPIAIDLEFKTSLKIEFYATGGVAFANWIYSAE